MARRRTVSAGAPALPGLEPVSGVTPTPIDLAIEPGGTLSLPGLSHFPPRQGGAARADAPPKPSKRGKAVALAKAPPPPPVSAGPDHLARKRPVDDLAAPFCGEVEAWAVGHALGPLIGLDEAGRGPLAGPVVVAACVMPWPCALIGIDDSKRLTEEAREALFQPILEQALATSVIIVEPDVIDELNILHASLHGMRLAWEDLVARHAELAPARVLVDGKDRAPLPDHVTQHPLVKGDSRSLNIAAASILAKVTRDRIMCEAHTTWPVYGFDRHKGYPTLAHRRAIAEHGPCPIHRRSFTLLAPAANEATAGAASE